MSAGSAGARKPRLLVLASTFPRWAGDPEPGFVHELARRLVSEFDVCVLCPHAPGARATEIIDGLRVNRYRYAPEALETLVNNGGIIANLRRSPWKWLLLPTFFGGLLWSAWREIARWRPHVAHAHWLLPQGLVLALVERIHRHAPGFVVTSHGADLFALRAAPLQALKRFVAARAAGITVVSSAMREEMIRLGVSPVRILVQPMGVDLLDRFFPDAAVEREADSLLFVGRLVEKKGLRHLIDAMPAILDQRPGAILSVAGFGPEEAERRAQVAALGLQSSVRFLGAISQDELPRLYRQAAVFVAPFTLARDGDEEGLGLVCVEAAGCGARLVLGDVGAVRGSFDTVPGVRFAVPGDARSLAEQVLAALSAPPPEDTAIEGLRARFDWRVRAAEYARILLSACEARQGDSRTPSE